MNELIEDTSNGNVDSSNDKNLSTLKSLSLFY